MPDLPKKDSGFSYYGPRLKVAGVIMLCVLGILGFKLWSLQVIQGKSYEELSVNNRVRLVRSPPTRGRIYDTKARLLAENVPAFSFSIVPGDIENPYQVVKTCAPLLGLPEERFRATIERSRAVPKFITFPIKKNIPLEELSLLKAKTAELKGTVLEIRSIRNYPAGETLCHTIGNIGEISLDELTKGSRIGYRPGDLVGKSGLEKEYEQYLKGEEGWEQIEIDARGRQLRTVSTRPPKSGADIFLTIDSEFQSYIESIFLHRAGSVAAVDPDTGRLLALVSKPGFDLGMFSPAISERQWRNLNQDFLHPLENRAIRGLYPPGSTFKIVTALAGLCENVIDYDKSCVCKGSLELSNQVFRCWNPSGHGKVSLHKAIIESCDVYFYELGLKLGPEKIAKYAALFGLGSPTGLGLQNELPGLIPTPTWKARNQTDSWKDGETVTISIGQGYMTATPIQLAMMTAAVAGNGTLLRPAVVKQIVSSDGKSLYEHSPVKRWDLNIEPKHLKELQKCLFEVVTDKHGTGERCKIPGINIHAKTGTSQVIRSKHPITEEDRIPYHERTHAMFVAYVNDRPKKIALAVIVEHGGGGGASAAPIARKIIAKYYGVPDPGDQ